ncbi:hypothetical protein EHS25_006994 [Saitozyma podzolica]|uniref:Uncharacterized protein n=1 Tax=Saitozyma podzolica TaxID=1890683 RepID=A0A427XPR6_9TREE|nr:hypothetical protein EHS25_006994 [Saitozyma podzolica]
MGQTRLTIDDGENNAFSDKFKGQQAVFFIGRAFSIIGGLITDASPKSGELENEDDAWRAYLVANGLDVSEMGRPIETSWSTTVKQALEAAERE